MRYRFLLADGPADEENLPDADDQRARPRSGPIEKIADITFDTLRKYEDALPPDEAPKE